MRRVGYGIIVVGLLAGAGALVFSTPGPSPSNMLDPHRPTVMVFVGRTCPISNRYAPVLERLYHRFKDRVAFQLIYPAGRDTPEEITQHLREYGLSWTPQSDPDHRRVALAGVSITPEAAVFDANGHLAYRGRIDDRWINFGRSRPAPTQNDLAKAIESIVRGQRPKVTRTKAVGCYISEKMKRGI